MNIKDQSGVEKITLYRSLYGESISIFLFIVTSILCIVYSDTSTYLRQDIFQFVINETAYTLSLPLIGILPFLILAYTAHRIFDCKYIIADSYIRELSGLASFKKKDKRLEFYNIRGIDIDRSLLNRILNVGDLKIGGSMHDEVEVVFSGIRNPSKYRDIVVERMKDYRFSERKEADHT